MFYFRFLKIFFSLQKNAQQESCPSCNCRTQLIYYTIPSVISLLQNRNRLYQGKKRNQRTARDCDFESFLAYLIDINATHHQTQSYFLFLFSFLLIHTRTPLCTLRIHSLFLSLSLSLRKRTHTNNIYIQINDIQKKRNRYHIAIYIRRIFTSATITITNNITDQIAIRLVLYHITHAKSHHIREKESKQHICFHSPINISVLYTEKKHVCPLPRAL